MSDTSEPSLDDARAATVGSPVQWLKTGTVRLHTSSGPIMLRRPSIGELRRFREHWYDVNEQISEAGHPVSLANAKDQLRIGQLAAFAMGADVEGEDVEPPADPDDTSAEQREIRVRVRKRSNDFEELCEQLRYDWLADVVNTLAMGKTTKLPPLDDCDAVFVSVEFCQQLIGHVSSVPLDSGAS